MRRVETADRYHRQRKVLNYLKLLSTTGDLKKLGWTISVVLNVDD